MPKSPTAPRQRLDDLPPLPDAEEETDIVWQHLRAQFAAVQQLFAEEVHALVNEEGTRWSSTMREPGAAGGVA